MSQTADVVVIGGGIIGCTIAWQLAKKGVAVTLVERGQPGEEASGAAAGMLAPQAEVAHGSLGPLFRLCLASHEIYPDFVAELEETTQIRIGYGQTGTLFVATSFEEATMLAAIMQQQEEAGLPSEELNSTQIHELEPCLAGSVQVGLLLPMDHHVENRVLMKALVAAGLEKGVRYLTGTPALGLITEGESVKGVRIPGGPLTCGVVINAAGSWAGDLDPRLRLEIPVKPTRGQIAQLQMFRAPFHHMIHSVHGYMVAWPDGRVLVGSTLESAGFNKSVTAGGVHRLLEGAIKLVPSLAEASLNESWAGFRPESADDIPILGWSRMEGLIVAGGHFRNGILLAPITAQLISDLVMKKIPAISLEPFSPARFLSSG